MRAGWHLCFVCLAFSLAGCAGDGDKDIFSSFRNPFRTERGFDPAKAPTASAKVATRVHTVGNDVVARNVADVRTKPVFFTVGLPDPMIFHRNEREIIISEGLVERCSTDAELAAAICFELGKMSAEKAERGTFRSERELPPAPRLSSDVIGSGQYPDMTRMAEEGYNDQRAGRPAARSREIKPDPKKLAQDYFAKAGYTTDELTRMQTLLKQSEENSEKRDILKGR